MFTFALALAFSHPADACAMPRMEQIAVAPVAPAADAVQQRAEPAPLASLEDALAAIDNAGIPEAKIPPAPAAKNRAAAAEPAPPTGAAPPQS